MDDLEHTYTATDADDPPERGEVTPPPPTCEGFYPYMPPNPGSDAAVAAGCTCPVLDNARGRGIGGGLFWITGGCPLHDNRR